MCLTESGLPQAVRTRFSETGHLLSGPTGSGKTTACRLGYQAMMDAWGHRAAAIDTDQLYFNVDALFELAYDRARNAMVLCHAAQLAISPFEHGRQTVIILGNSHFDPDDTAPILARLCPVAEVYHVTLAPALQAVLARCGPDLPGRGPSRLAENAEIHARKRHPARPCWTIRP